MGGEHWMQKDLDLLHHLTLARTPWEQIACELYRTARSCEDKARRMGWVKSKPRLKTLSTAHDYECTLDYWLDTYHAGGKRRA